MSSQKRSQIMIDADNQARSICLENQARMAKQAEEEHKRREQQQVTETIVKAFDEQHAPKPLTPQQKAAQTKARNLSQAEDKERLAREKAFAEKEIALLHEKQARVREALSNGVRPSRRR